MQKKYGEYGRSLALGAVAGVTLALVFAAGFFLRDLVPMPALASGGDYPLLARASYLLEQNYLRDIPNETQQEYAAIKGLLTSLNDGNTFFIEPSTAQSESQALAGRYGGIGVQLQRSETGDFILFPFEDSPARAAGIREGDVLVAVDDAPISVAMQQDAVDQLLRGEVKTGNGVEVTVEQIDGEALTVFVEFAEINIPSVVWRVLPDAEDIGYVHILRFTNRTPDELRQALAELRETSIEALVLDLRNNGGGLLQESVDVASEFLDGGVVLYERTNRGEKTFNAESGGTMTDLPLVVLVNEGTASAAELVAGALQDRGRGILIGQQTYGKGTIQQIFQLQDSSSIHVTSAEWFTPNRGVIDGVGLEPDIPMIPDENGRDVEIGEAVRYLQEQLAQGTAS